MAPEPEDVEDEEEDADDEADAETEAVACSFSSRNAGRMCVSSRFRTVFEISAKQREYT